LPGSETALFLDLDGTLAPFAPTPGAARLPPGVLDTLCELSEMLGGRMAVVSGRQIEDVDALLYNRLVCVSGAHGMERRMPDGRIIAAPPAAGLEGVIDAIEAIASADPGVILEWKRSGVALHYRNAPNTAPALVELAERLADACGLTIQHGVQVVELRTPGPTKGDAVKAYMAEAPFLGAVPVFVGDDLTDEAGFYAARLLQGHAIIVGDRRPTAAGYRLPDPAAVHAWLARAAETGSFDIKGLPWAA